MLWWMKIEIGCDLEESIEYIVIILKFLNKVW